MAGRACASAETGCSTSPMGGTIERGMGLGKKTILGFPAAGVQPSPPAEPSVDDLEAAAERRHAEGKVDFGAFKVDDSWDTDDPEASGIFALATGLLFAGRYRLVARIARGGMGSVWSATDEKLGRPVAIKFMSADFAEDDEYRHRFEQEARAAARLQSLHVVGIHDHGVAEGIPFIVLERLEGEDLHRRLRRVPRIPIQACDRIFTQAARALRAAHDAGIVHRDIKPQNLFLSRSPEGEPDEEVVKLLDFGVAKHAGTKGLHTKTGVLVGSPHFMSPEQVRGVRNVDFRTDLFSLAAVIYRCVSGERPFEGDMPTVMLKISREPPRPISTVAPDLPPALDAFFARALANDPQQRFDSAVAMALAFHEIAEAAPGAAAGGGETPTLTRDATLRFAARRSDVEADAEDLEARPSEHPTRLAPMPEDALGPPSSAHVSDFPTQMVPVQQVMGFTDGAARTSLAPSPWKEGAPLPASLDASLEPYGPGTDGLGRRATRIAVAIVGALVGVLLVLVVVLVAMR
jgi:serine/threonine protein kinase